MQNRVFLAAKTKLTKLLNAVYEAALLPLTSETINEIR